MSISPLLPYVRTCGFCENGLLRFWICQSEKRCVALCDECELYWEDIAAVHADQQAPSSGAYPALKGEWRAATSDEVQDCDLGDYVRGESE